MHLIFTGGATHEDFLTTKISRSTVYIHKYSDYLVCIIYVGFTSAIEVQRSKYKGGLMSVRYIVQAWMGLKLVSYNTYSGVSTIEGF